MERNKSGPGTRGPKSKITQQLPDSFIALGAKQSSPRDDPKRTVPLPKSSVSSHIAGSSGKAPVDKLKRDSTSAGITPVNPSKKIKVNIPGSRPGLSVASGSGLLPIERMASGQIGAEPWESLVIECDTGEIFENIVSQINNDKMDKANSKLENERHTDHEYFRTLSENNDDDDREDKPDIIPIPLSTINEQFHQIIENQTTIIDNQKKIIRELQRAGTKDNQLKIIQQLAKMELMFNDTATKPDFKIAAASSSSPSSSSYCKKKKNGVIIKMELINTLEDLARFDEDLRDVQFMEQMADKLSDVCGEEGNGHGINNCFILVDKLFTRHLFTLCSWAGGSRDNSREKAPFKIYKNIIGLFFHTIRLSDDEFSLKKCEEFFKNVIRNSTRRNVTTIARISRTKRRPKKISNDEQEREEREKKVLSMLKLTMKNRNEHKEPRIKTDWV